MQVGSPIEMTEDALAGLMTLPQGGGQLRTIRSSHHQVAQGIARGLTDIEVANVTGYSPMRISQLKRDPTFQELIAGYSGTVQREFADVVARMATLSLDALEEIQSRLDEKPEELSTSVLLELAKSTLDRTGHAPVQKMQSTVSVLTKADILELKRAARESVVASPLLAIPASGENNGPA